MKRIAPLTVVLVSVSLFVGCTDVAKRKESSLASLKYSTGSEDMLYRRDRLVDAVNKATTISLASPHIVCAIFTGRLRDKTGFIVVDWISAQPIADGLVINLRDGSAVTCRIDKANLDYNQKEAKRILVFGASIGVMSHPDIWGDLAIESIVSVQLTKDGSAVSNICEFKILEHREDGQSATDGTSSAKASG